MKRQYPELQIHKALVQHIRLRGCDDMLWTHVPLGGWRDAKTGALMKLLGARAGTPDLLFWHQGHSMALELKADGGRATEAQLEWLDDFRNAGGHGVVAEGLDEAVRILEYWNVIR